MKNNNSLINEWIVRAEHDFETAELLIEQKSRGYEIICFHCQQCIEKYLKAFLIKNNRDYPRIHDLVKLINLCIEHDNSLIDLREKLSELNEYAVAGRYPGEFIDQEDSMVAFVITSEARSSIKNRLTL